MTDVRPMGSYIFVRRQYGQFERQRESQTESGLVVLSDAQGQRWERGTVEAVGPGEWQSRKRWDGLTRELVRQPMAVQPGDTVVFDRYAGTDYSDTHVFLTPEEILGVEQGE